MSPTRILANIYLRNGVNRRIATTPGRSVQFFGGHATVVNHLDMPHMLQLDGALVQPTPDAMPWAADWLAKVTQIKAEMTWPAGWRVKFVNPNEFTIRPPRKHGGQAMQATPTVSAPVETVDITARPPGWVSPASLVDETNPLLEDPEDEI